MKGNTQWLPCSVLQSDANIVHEHVAGMQDNDAFAVILIVTLTALSEASQSRSALTRNPELNDNSVSPCQPLQLT